MVSFSTASFWYIWWGKIYVSCLILYPSVFHFNSMFSYPRTTGWCPSLYAYFMWSLSTYLRIWLKPLKHQWYGTFGMTVPTAPSEHISFIINLPFKVAPVRHVETGLSHCIYDLCVFFSLLRCILFLHISGDFCSSLVSNQTDQEHFVSYSPVFYFRRSVICLS